MPSTFTTDPVGPRSIDEMLDVVYTRAGHMRRRQSVKRMGAAALAVLMAAAGVVTLRSGEDSASRLRAGDRTGAEQEAFTPPSVEATGRQGDSAAAGASVGTSPRAPEAPKPDGPKEVDATVDRPDGVTIPKDGRPTIETWGTDTDVLNDSSPSHWYLDISSVTMQFDVSAEVVVFTTRYRLPDQPAEAARETRILRSDFHYDEKVYKVEVRESSNQLGMVTIEETFECPECTRGFDVATGRLEVRVPVAKLNAVVTRDEAPALASGAEIMSLQAFTFHVDGNLPPIESDSSPNRGE